MKTLLLSLLVAGFYALHQDFWNWDRVDPMFLGFIPVGLAYHAAYSCLASVLMCILVRLAWPAHLEADSDRVPGTGRVESDAGEDRP